MTPEATATPKNPDAAADSLSAPTAALDGQSYAATPHGVAQPIANAPLMATAGDAVEVQHSANMQPTPENPPVGGGESVPETSGAEAQAADKRPANLRKKKRPGAPDGNRNRCTHHLRRALIMGRLPKTMAYVASVASQFRRQLEDVVVAQQGELSIGAAAVIQSAARHERHSLLCQHWLRQPDLTPDQKLAFSRDATRASDSRDRCLKALGLDPKPADRRTIAASIYSTPVRETIIEPHQSAVEARMGDETPAGH